jgi:outer membrane protein OmpA-like peptidoglycan-associated protein
LEYPGKWTIVLGLTSNSGAQDFEMQKTGNAYLYETVLKKVAQWGTPENMMFVVGATQASAFAAIRQLTPDHFYLVPGVGAQGGSLKEISQQAMIKDCGLLVNASRAIIYASSGADFAEAAQKQADDAFKAAALANNRINGLDDYDTIKTIPVLFAVNSSVINKAGRQTIDEAAAWAKEEKAKGNANGWLVEVVGFADKTGNTAKNRALSERRSKAVIQYLVGVHGLDLRRLVQPFGFGESKPVADNKTAAGRAKNHPKRANRADANRQQYNGDDELGPFGHGEKNSEGGIQKPEENGREPNASQAEKISSRLRVFA